MVITSCGKHGMDATRTYLPAIGCQGRFEEENVISVDSRKDPGSVWTVLGQIWSAFAAERQRNRSPKLKSVAHRQKIRRATPHFPQISLRTRETRYAQHPVCIGKWITFPAFALQRRVAHSLGGQHGLLLLLLPHTYDKQLYSCIHRPTGREVAATERCPTR